MRRRPPRATTIDQAGWLPRATRIDSPHYDERPPDEVVTLFVVHNISLPPGVFTGDAVIDFFLGRIDCAAHPYFEQLRGVRVSSHFFIRRSGELIQFVSCAQRAWHAGVSMWHGRPRCNDFSIGVELEGTDDQSFTDAQYAELMQLIRAVSTRYPITDIVGHSEIAPGRKTDPGPFFEWARVR